ARAAGGRRWTVSTAGDGGASPLMDRSEAPPPRCGELCMGARGSPPRLARPAARAAGGFRGGPGTRARHFLERDPPALPFQPIAKRLVGELLQRPHAVERQLMERLPRLAIERDQLADRVGPCSARHRALATQRCGQRRLASGTGRQSSYSCEMSLPV